MPQINCPSIIPKWGCQQHCEFPSDFANHISLDGSNPIRRWIQSTTQIQRWCPEQQVCFQLESWQLEILECHSSSCCPLDSSSPCCWLKAWQHWYWYWLSSMLVSLSFLECNCCCSIVVPLAQAPTKWKRGKSGYRTWTERNLIPNFSSVVSKEAKEQQEKRWVCIGCKSNE